MEDKPHTPGRYIFCIFTRGDHELSTLSLIYIRVLKKKQMIGTHVFKQLSTVLLQKYPILSCCEVFEKIIKSFLLDQRFTSMYLTVEVPAVKTLHFVRFCVKK